MSRVRSWWVQPDHFEWMETFLRRRGMLPAARLTMAGIAISSALVPITLLSHPGTLSVPSFMFGVIGAVVSLWVIGFWLARWPTRWQSEAFVIAGSATMVGWSLSQSDTALAAMGSTALAVTGSYIAYFHNTKLLLANFVLAIVASVVAAYRLATEAGASPVYRSPTCPRPR